MRLAVSVTGVNAVERHASAMLDFQIDGCSIAGSVDGVQLEGLSVGPVLLALQ